MAVPISSWPEWLACAVVAAAVLVGSKIRRSSIAAIMMAVPLAWVFGTAGGLLIPLTLGAVIWLVFA